MEGEGSVDDYEHDELDTTTAAADDDFDDFAEDVNADDEFGDFDDGFQEPAVSGPEAVSVVS